MPAPAPWATTRVAAASFGRIHAAPTSPDVGSWMRLRLSGVAMPESCQMAGTLYLGTSGFSYDEWKHGVFYPEGLKNREMLSYYASRFPSVEINYTFRRFPTEKSLETWKAETPEALPVHAEGQPADHALEAAGRRGRGRPGLPRAGAAARRSPRDRAVPVPAHAHVRPRPDRVVRRLPAAGAPSRRWSSATRRGCEARDLLLEQGVAWCVAETDETRPGPRRPVVGAVRVPAPAQERVLGRRAARVGRTHPPGPRGRAATSTATSSTRTRDASTKMADRLRAIVEPTTRVSVSPDRG